MNEEKKIAQAIMNAQAVREANYDKASGEYIIGIEDCLIKACEEQGLSSNLWALLSLAMHWWNDIQLWAEDVLADRDVMDSVITQEKIDRIISKDEVEEGKERTEEQAEDEYNNHMGKPIPKSLDQGDYPDDVYSPDE